MWIFTKYGFFSIVDKGHGIQIRARNRKHLVDLKKRMRGLQGTSPWKIETTPTNDYGWRIIVARSVWNAIASILADEITWNNFKTEVCKSNITDPEFDNVLHKVWYEMMAYQRRTGPKHLGDSAFGQLLLK